MKHLIIYVLISAVFVSCGSSSRHLMKKLKSDHFNFETEKFFNPHLKKRKGLKDVLTWLWNRDKAIWPEKVNLKATPKIANELSSDEIVVTFVNHATFLIQMKGINILTDPVWSERVSPLSFVGPKRVSDPGIEFKKLPKIDIVLISHNHYDHMDLNTLKKLEKTHSPTFFVPMLNREFLISEGLTKVIEMDWWNEFQLSNDTKISFVPAQHFSGRGLFDHDKTLWGGLVVEHLDLSFYFAGDTGHSVHFKEIGEKFKNLDIAFLPIGAYEPRWFMKDMHINPKEAVSAHEIIKPKLSIGMHFGCFQLTDEAIDQPVIDMQKALQEKNISENQMRTLEIGQTLYYVKQKNVEKINEKVTITD